MPRSPPAAPLYQGSALVDMYAKGLVAIPAFLRAAGDFEVHVMALFDHPRHPCIAAVHASRVESAEWILGAESAHAFAMIESAPWDAKGRIVLPARLVCKAKIEDRVLFVGCGPTFQMWSPAVALEQGTERFRALAARHLKRDLGTVQA